MVQSFRSNAWRPSPGSWLANWLNARPHPDSFICGVLVRDSGRGGKTGRWQYRRSAVDRLLVGEVVTLNHGTKDRLRLRIDPDPYSAEPRPRPRPGLTVLVGTVVDSGARVLIAVPPGEVARFGMADS